MTAAEPLIAIAVYSSDTVTPRQIGSISDVT